MSESKQPPSPPTINPFLFPVILAILGIWCFYDGWLSTDPEMQKHLLFNRVLACVLIPWSIWDFFRTKKRVLEEKKTEKEQSNDQQ